MTVGDLAYECGLNKHRAVLIARANIRAFARIHKGEAYGLTHSELALLRPLFLAERPAPRPPMLPGLMPEESKSIVDIITADISSVLSQAAEMNIKLMAVIEQLKIPAEFGQAVMDDGQCYGFATAAKMLSPKLLEMTGHDLGRDRLIDALKALRILNENREPYQQYAHHFKIVLKQTPVGMQPTSLLTGKGLAWVLPKLVEYYA